MVKPVGRANYAFVDDLDPYTQYEIRIQACQNGKMILKDSSLCLERNEDLPNRFNSVKQIKSNSYIGVKCLPSEKESLALNEALNISACCIMNILNGVFKKCGLDNICHFIENFSQIA